MEKTGKIKLYRGKCPECRNKFNATAEDMFLTRDAKTFVETPMIRCPYCNVALFRFFGLWVVPSWQFTGVYKSR